MSRTGSLAGRRVSDGPTRDRRSEAARPEEADIVDEVPACRRSTESPIGSGEDVAQEIDVRCAITHVEDVVACRAGRSVHLVIGIDGVIEHAAWAALEKPLEDIVLRGDIVDDDMVPEGRIEHLVEIGMVRAAPDRIADGGADDRRG